MPGSLNLLERSDASPHVMRLRPSGSLWRVLSKRKSWPTDRLKGGQRLLPAGFQIDDREGIIFTQMYAAGLQ